MKEKEEKQVLDFGIKDTITKKEMKQLFKKKKRKENQKSINFLVSFFRKFQFRKFRNRNKKLVEYNPAE